MISDLCPRKDGHLKIIVLKENITIPQDLCFSSIRLSILSRASESVPLLREGRRISVIEDEGVGISRLIFHLLISFRNRFGFMKFGFLILTDLVSIYPYLGLFYIPNKIAGFVALPASWTSVYIC